MAAASSANCTAIARSPTLADDLLRLGYEENQAWLSVLEGVEPVMYPCRYPERKPYLKDWERDLRVFLKSRHYLRQRLG